MRTNRTKAKVEAGKTAFGAAVGFHSPDTVELLGALGFDYVTLDLEHEVFDELAVQHSIRAAEAFNITPVVRIPNDPNVILRLLDAGAQGVHIPRVNTRQDAEAVVAACRFHPQGARTFFAAGRTGNYGVDLTEEEYAEISNRETLITLQIEEEEGVRNIEEILAVPYVDIIQLGPKDLWQSMGMPDRERVWEVIDQVIGKAVKAGRWVSMYTWMTAEFQQQVAHYKSMGVNMVTVQARDLLMYGARSFMERSREAIGLEE
ncbi:MAG: aldolase/citrate lyase family protein [Chloroflexi bacterium]|nr:aldolase/citrate lyase family protein [Chloroflexota bacterium]